MTFDPNSYSLARVVHDHVLAEAANRRQHRAGTATRPVRAAIGAALIRLGEAIGGRPAPTHEPAAPPAVA